MPADLGDMSKFDAEAFCLQREDRRGEGAGPVWRFDLLNTYLRNLRKEAGETFCLHPDPLGERLPRSRHRFMQHAD